MDCLFCKIASGEIPSHKIYEGEKFMAFLDINPRTPGHCLVIPKQHFSTLLDMSDEEIYGLFSTSKKIASRIIVKTGAKAFNLCVNNGKEAGQVIPHVHVHIMPRHDDGGGAIETCMPVRNDIKQRLDEFARLLSE